MENDIYLRNFKILKFIGVNFNYDHKMLKRNSINEIEVCKTPRIFIHPSFAVLIKDFRKSFKNFSINTDENIYLYLKGNLYFENCTFKRCSVWFENKNSDK